MAVTVGADSYGDESGLGAYATARGVTISGHETELLIKAMDWLEIQSFKSCKLVETQSLQFPRYEYNYGDTYGEVPGNIVTAQYVVALLIDSGEDMNASVGRAIKRERVDVLEVEYMDNASSTTMYPQLDLLLKDYLSGFGGTFEVKRA